MTVGNLIKKYRSDNGISMDEFAKRSSLSKGYISMLENDIGPRDNKPIAPTLPSLRKIATGMGIDIDTLMKLLDGHQKVSLTNEAHDNASDIVSFYNRLNTYGKTIATEQVRLLTLDQKYTCPDSMTAAKVIQMPVKESLDHLIAKAAHNDHINEPGELEKTERDLAGLQRPNR